MKKIDPRLRTQPWKIFAVFDPIERILSRIEREGVVDAAGGVPVFHEDSRGGWYEVVPAINGVIEFHEHAQTRYGLQCDVSGLKKLAKKLELGAPLFTGDITAARASIDTCKQQAGALRVSQALDLVRTVQISMEMDKLQQVAA